MATTQTDRSNSTPVTNQTDRASGLRSSTAIKGPCIAAATVNTTLSGEQTVNAIVCVDGDRVLLTGQTDAKQNGIYLVSTGDWVRTADFKNSTDVFEGTSVRVTRGTNAGLWVVTVPQGDVDVEVDEITFTKDAASLAGAVLTANNGSDFQSKITTFNTLLGSAATISAAATVDLSDQSVMTGFYGVISGNTNISAFTMDTDQVCILRFTGTPIITAGATLVLSNDAQNIQIEVGDHAILRKGTSTVYFTHLPVRQRANLVQKGSNLASAANLVFGDYDYVHVTGTTTITDVDFTKAYDGKRVFAEFDSALSITHSANLECPGSTNLSVAAGDVVMFIQDASDAVKVVPLGAASNTVAGVQDLYVPAGALIPRITNGPSAGVIELATNDVMLATLDYDQTTSEGAQFMWVPPKRWNGGTVTARFYWTAASGAGTVTWAIAAQAFSNDDAMDAAFGTAQSVTDTLITANDMHITDATAAMTIGGSPADLDAVMFQVTRDISDTLTADAKLIGVVVFWTASTGTDA